MNTKALLATTALTALGTSMYFLSSDNNLMTSDDLKVSSTPLLGLLDESLNQDDLEQFNNWISKNARSYKNHSEYLLRFKAFQRNLQRIRSYNLEAVEAMKQDSEFEPSKVGLNDFSDWTEEEYKHYIGPKISNESSSSSEKKEGVKNPPPESVDWTTKGVVPPVHNDKPCGAGWAIIAASTIQSRLAINRGDMGELSAEQFNDCS